MSGTANRTLLLVLLSVAAVVACSEPTSPRGSGARPAAADSSTAPAPPPPVAALVVDSIHGITLLRDSAIWQVDSAAKLAQLLKSWDGISAAAVSHAGMVAFVPTGTGRMCIAAPSEPEPRCIATGYADITGLAWSPDGARVVFSGYPPIPLCDFPSCVPVRSDLLTLTVFSMTVGTLVVPPDHHFARGPSWSPDGSVIAFAMDGGIWLVNADGSQRRVLTSDVGGLYAVVGVRWSPDGRRFTVGMEATDRCSWFCDTAVGTVNADGSGLHVLATATEANAQFVGGWPHGAPIWSPDGSRIAFGRSDCSAGWDPCREQEWVVDAAGGTPQQLLEGATLLDWRGR